MGEPSLERKRALERGRILYCLDYIMHSLNDEDAIEPWLMDGCPDGTLEGKNWLTDEQVEDHAVIVGRSQDELDEMVALAAKILFREVYPKAYRHLKVLGEMKQMELFRPERCVLT